MKKIFVFMICPLFFFNLLFSQEFYSYEEQTGNRKSNFTWNVEKTNKNIEICGEEDEASTTMYFTKDFVMYKYFYKSKIFPTEYELSLENNILTARGKVNNLTVGKTHNLATPWIQQFGFGLKPFVLSDKKSIDFSFIIPKDFSIQKMVAQKEGKEFVSSNGKQYETQKVTITLAGFKSRFWKARLWFDSTTGDLVKYAANKGPNTETTIDMLLSIEIKEGSSEKIEKSPVIDSDNIK